MTTPQLRTFSSFDEANAARDALVAAGADPQSMELRVMETEAGPAEGNFLVGNGRHTSGGTEPLGSAQHAPYDDNFKRAVHRGEYLLIIQSSLPQDVVESVLRRFDCIAP
jgi:hypothetical protein